MSYRRALLRRWARHDWFAILIIALTVAFLTGTGVIIDATASRTTEIAAEQSNPASATWYPSPEAARAAATQEALVLPVAQVNIDGDTATLVGIPPDATRFANRTGVTLPSRPPDGTVHHRNTTATVRLAGTAGNTTVTVRPAGQSVLSPAWYYSQAETVQRLGATAALVVHPSQGETPLRAALTFFTTGARSALRLFGLVAVGASILLGVVVFGVTRVTVQERWRTIRTIRATGGAKRTVLALFAGRAAMQTAVGVVFGYAVGVIVTNAAVSVAVFTGQPVALAPDISMRLAQTLLPAYGLLVGVGGVGGVVAAWPLATRPPMDITPDSVSGSGDASESRLAGIRTRLGQAVPTPTLLGWRAVLPAATTLAVFLAFTLVAVSTYGAVAPVAGGHGAAVTQPAAPHPLASEVPRDYAAALRDRGIAASPEILLLAVHDGQPYIARGANWSAFATLSDARVIRGRAPTAPGEAVIGTDLARTLDLAVGERFMVSGSTTPALARVRITGVYTAREPYDDQLIVPLSTARHLAGVPPGSVQFIRTERLPATAGTVSVVGVTAPRTVPAGESVPVSVTVVNPTPTTQSRSISIHFGDRQRALAVTLRPGVQRTITKNFTVASPGPVSLTVANTTRTVQVVSPDALRVTIPRHVPVGSAPLIRVHTATGTPVENATVTVGQTTRVTESDGTVRFPFTQTGRVRVVVTKGQRRVTEQVTVAADGRRRLQATVAVTPLHPTVVTTPTARVTVQNPWNQTLSQTITVRGPGEPTNVSVRLAPGAMQTVTTALARRPPGRYTVAVEIGKTLTTARYRVIGDARLAASLAATGRDAAASGFGKAAQVIFGNLKLLVGVLLLLVALMTVGATTAAFAGAVQGRRRTLGIHRAVGATPWQVLRLVTTDALIVGTVATGLGLLVAGSALWVLAATDVLTLYGVRLLSMVSPRLVVAAAVVAVTLAVAGALVTTWRALTQPPTSLLAGSRASPPQRQSDSQTPVSDTESRQGTRRHTREKTRGEDDA